jgi:NAD(P)H dehydrogenase (quinone)
MTETADPTLLVTGGSGHLGRRVIDLLLQNTKSKIIATTRNPEAMADFAARGVDVRKADHDEAVSLPAAYAGAERMLIIPSHSVGRRFEQIRRVVPAAEAAGVKHVIYVSTPSAMPSKRDHVTNDHFWSELAVTSSKLTWTILRHNMWTEHIFLFLPIAAATGKLISAMGEHGRGYVTREDSAYTDAAVLASNSTDCQIFDVTGPGVVTQEDLAGFASELTGRPIKYVRATAEETLQSLIAGGLPPDRAKSVLEFELFAGQGYHSMVTPTVKDLTGRDPESVHDYVYRNRADLVPDEQGRANIEVLRARLANKW